MHQDPKSARVIAVCKQAGYSSRLGIFFQNLWITSKDIKI